MIATQVELSSRAALLIIDVQNGFDDPRWGARNNHDAEPNIASTLAAFRERSRRVIHVKHDSKNPTSPLHPGHYGNSFKDAVAPLEGEPVFTKSVNSAFIGTGLLDHLTDASIDSLYVVGLTTDHCVSTTVRMGSNLGLRMVVASDSTATFDRSRPDGSPFSAQLVHDVAVASLHGEFATVVRSFDEVMLS